MWILFDYLAEFSPKAHIRNGDMVLTNVRMLSETALTSPTNVYLAKSSEYFQSDESSVICIHGEDLVFLETDDI